MLRQPIKLLLTVFTLLPAVTWALPSDRNKPIEIEADHAQMDDSTGITQYKGNAILTQGTLKIQGDIITFYYDENKELSKMIAQGKLAKYRQVQKPGEEAVKAQALTMEYHARAQKVYLLGKGQITQHGDKFTGSRITYDIAKNIVNAGSAKGSSQGGAKSERISIIIQPPGSKKKSTTPVKASPSEPAISSDNANYLKGSITTTLNTRTGPGPNYKKLGKFQPGDSVYILTEQRGWVQVRGTIDGQAVIGWVSKRYVKEQN